MGRRPWRCFLMLLQLLLCYSAEDVAGTGLLLKARAADISL